MKALERRLRQDGLKSLAQEVSSSPPKPQPLSPARREELLKLMASPNARNRHRIPQRFDISSRRRANPARLRGRVQLAAERVLFLYGTATTSDVVDYAHALRLVMRQERRHNWLSFGARRALESIGAQRVGRAGTRGRPILWALR